MRVTDHSIHGKHVISADGNIIGNVDAVYIDGTSLRLDCLSVAVRKDVSEKLGVEHGVFRKGCVEIPVDQIQSIGETIVLAVPLASLRTVAPELPPEKRTTKQPEPRTDAERPIQPHPHI
jgi:sporulation protein YlmC with PRC-barrel domain